MKNNKKVISLSLIALLSFVSLMGCADNTSSDNISSGDSSSISSSSVKDEDIVGETHLKLDADIFTKVMTNKSKAAYDKEKSDFNVTGVERMLTLSDYAPNKESAVFTNYVDGDTTQFTTYNGNYNVKVRYLAVDTPESTSEIQEWGKSASLFNKGILTAAKHVIVQSATSAKTGKEGEPDLDGYQRSLAYVWYSNDDNPTQDSFRNLNLELVYQGYSLFSGKREDMDSDFYDSFMKANDIAIAFKKHLYTDAVKSDTHYYYDAPKALGLDQLYDESLYTNKDANDVPYSLYCDEYTRWTFEGVVTRKVGNAFYIQDKIDGKYYGLYVFTLRSYAPIVVGNRIKVSGVLSWYGGAYELSGVSYSFFNHSEGDIEYVLDADGNKVKETVTPIEATPAEIGDGKYNSVLVTLKDSSKANNYIYFNTTISQNSSYAYGGSEELNAYNEAYPFYNTDNSMVLFGHFGSDMENVSTFSTLMSDSNYIRIKIPSDINLSDNDGNTITSYKYYCGTNNASGNEDYHYYIPKNAPLTKAIATASSAKQLYDGSDYTSVTAPVAGDMYVEGEFNKPNANVYTYNPTTKAWDKTATDITVYQSSFQRKRVTDVVGIAQQYESTSGNVKYSINIASAKNDFGNFVEVKN
jgi:endonuclease YncB( thermonuclease family)